MAPDAPYFVDEHGAAWTPIGQNDAVSWDEFAGLWHRADLTGVRRHLRWLRSNGVTCLRLMLEYCQDERFFLERPAGTFDPAMVQLWDDLIGLCEQERMYLLLTPYDTFFTWNNWAAHPYNCLNGGPCADRTRLLTCPETRSSIKRRLAFVTQRWGASGAIFAWDLWNEMHPVQGEDRPGCFEDFIEDVGPFLRDLELRLHGRAHLQTVSVFGPELIWKPWLRAPIFRHPLLDFACVHLYEEGTIDFPLDTAAPALATARLIRDALDEITDMRPVLDTEHGPIHTFKDQGLTLPEMFDDEYFRHMQWAHLASGAAGGGMRWPNRSPHRLTRGMRRAQRALADFLPLIDWPRFRRRNLHGIAQAQGGGVAALGCGDEDQAVLWLLRVDAITEAGRLSRDVAARQLSLQVPGLRAGDFSVTFWDTERGQALQQRRASHQDEVLNIVVPAIATDVSVAIRRIGDVPA